ncbi:hypothetical protein [Lysinibacillus sp. RC79]|uniref:hypothetical protein n=1 Tax=Lysinibacillus sp. RC79 TaxID=3156296 RepID=UPI0035197199
MEQALQFNIGGIKCDNDTCDYRDDSVKVEDYDKWLNKPCPKCSTNLLTEADYNNVQMLLQTAQMINSLTSEQLEALTGNIDNDEIVQMSIEMNGTGKMEFKH